jgi:DNA modification methylase
VAAETYGRDWVGVEINEAYARLAEQRLATWRAKQGAAAS